MNINVGPAREGEHPAWKLLRLWPLAIVFVSFIVGYAALQSNVAVNAADITTMKKKDDAQDTQIQILKEQSVRVDERLGRVNEKLDDQRRAADELRGDVKRILDAVAPVPTPGRR